MSTTLNFLTSRSARRIIATAIEQGWDVEVTHGDGLISVGGRVLQDVPWCKIRAKVSLGKRALVAKVEDWNTQRAELEAAKRLSHLIDRVQHHRDRLRYLP